MCGCVCMDGEIKFGSLCVETGVCVQRWVCVCVCVCVYKHRDGCVVVNDGEVWRQRWVYVYVCVFLWIEDEWCVCVCVCVWKERWWYQRVVWGVFV